MTETNRHPLDTASAEPQSVEIPELRDRRPRPEGVVPRQSQAYVVVALSLLILGAVMFSKNQARTSAKPSPAAPVAASTDLNQRNIEELKRDLTAEQVKAEQAAQHENAAGSASALLTSSQSGSISSYNNSQRQTEPQRDPIKDAERALSFKARFASNLVPVGDAATHSPAPQNLIDREFNSEVTPLTPNRPNILETTRPAPTESSAPKRSPEVNVNSATGQPCVIFEGTTIDTALLNRLDGEFSGPVKVMVTNPVYSQDRQHVLVPEGTVILGEVERVSSFGQRRLALLFHRMLMPDGYSVDLDRFRGLDQAGETGLKDKINHHYLEIFGASIALGIISGAAETTASGGYYQSGSDMYRQGVASSLSQESAHVLDRFINVPPTLTIAEGHRIKVYLTQDLLLPAYENHTLPPNI